MNRRSLILVTMALALSLVGGVVVHSSAKDPILQKYRQLKYGMTVHEADEAVGAVRAMTFYQNTRSHFRIYQVEQGAVSLQFDAEGKLVEKQLVRVSLLDRLRACLPW